MKMKQKIKKIRDVKLPIIPVILSTVMLIYGTYAWFTYFSDVDSTMTGHVIGWNIDFDGKTNIENEYEIVINSVFPGMEDYVSDFKINNTGEATAMITREIVSVKIFDEEYKVGEEYEGEILTSDSLLELINEKYTFDFDMSISKKIIKTNETSIFNFTLTWPFETFIQVENDASFSESTEYYEMDGEEYKRIYVNESEYDVNKSHLYVLNDVKDTYWGAKAYEFKEQNPDEPCIKIEVIINASQYIE